MIYTAILVFHIVVACATVVSLVYTAWALVRRTNALYMKLGASIAALAAVETVTGVALVILSPDLSVMKVGLHLAAYLGVCMLAEGALLVGTQKSRVWIG